jgi:hypothetical protein
VTGLDFAATPGESYSKVDKINLNLLLGIVFETDAIDNTKPSNKDYLKNLSGN